MSLQEFFPRHTPPDTRVMTRMRQQAHWWNQQRRPERQASDHSCGLKSAWLMFCLRSVRRSARQNRRGRTALLRKVHVRI